MLALLPKLACTFSSFHKLGAHLLLDFSAIISFGIYSKEVKNNFETALILSRIYAKPEHYDEMITPT